MASNRSGTGRRLPVGIALLTALALAAPCAAAEWARRTSRDLELAEALEARVTVEFEVPTDLADVIAFLNEAIAQSTGIKNALHLDPKIVQLDPRPVHIVQHETKVWRVLNLLLTDASSQQEIDAGEELGYVPFSQGGVIYITNAARLRRLNMRRKEFRAYDVRDLLAAFPVGRGGYNNNNRNSSNSGN